MYAPDTSRFLRVLESGRSLPTPSLISSDFTGWGVGEGTAPTSARRGVFRLVWNQEGTA
jgi:hypothetical protein